MTIDLSVILPNTSQTLDGTGFIFGAGTSHEAGYPLMSGLTREVVASLTADQRAILDEVLGAAGYSYDDAAATPNIEQIADLIIAHWTNSGDPRFSALEARLREVILDRILSVANPNLDHHCFFFEALKRHAFGLPCCVWIFTTNYDLLFEIAAARTGVLLENGFCGATHRFFNPAKLRSCYGIVERQRFTQNPSLTVKLLKLHGSISWYEQDAKFYEEHPKALDLSWRRTMVLPRKRKILDTLTPPYDALFTLASKIIGSECKYLASCGFNYGDDHINDTVLLPAMQARKARLFVLGQEEPPGVAQFMSMPNCQGAFNTHSRFGGNRTPDTTSLWKFSEFVKLF